MSSGMEAINTGRIYHFIPKPWDPNELLVVVRRAAERYELARENARLKDELELACNAMFRPLPHSNSPCWPGAAAGGCLPRCR